MQLGDVATMVMMGGGGDGDGEYDGGGGRKGDAPMKDLFGNRVDDYLVPNNCGRAKRSKGAGETGRYGSANKEVSTSLKFARDTVRDCQKALEFLATKPVALHIVANPKASSEGMEICRCQNDSLKRPGYTIECSSNNLKRPGDTKEDAFEIDDDDDLQIVAFTPRPLLETPYLEKKHWSIDTDAYGAEYMEAAVLSSDDISGHQLRRMPGEDVMMEEAQNDKGSCTSSEAKAAVKSPTKGVKNPKASLSEKPASGRGDKCSGGKEDNVEEEEDFQFDSPKAKRPRAVVFAESDEDGPDFEVEYDSDSDRELTPERDDPFDDIWKDCDVMRTQMRKEDCEKEDEGCEHTYELKNDVGRACSKCGLIKENIKDMSFAWHRPRTLRKIWVRGERLDNGWDGADDGVLEEEAKLVGMPQLEAHPFLENSMHPHQQEGFKFLSRNLVEEGSGGCMLAFAPGTGKSFLIISFIQSFMVQVPNARPMIVAPKSMLRPWLQEFKKWEVEETLVLNLYEAEDQLEMLKQWQETSSVLLVGYAQIMGMSGEIGRYLTEGPGLMVLDEGHCARTESTKILKALSRVHTTRRVLLSGTPFNNNFEEFYTTLELVRPNFMQRANAQMCPTLNTLITAEPKPPVAVAGSILKRPSNAGRQAFKDVIGEKFESGKHDGISRALQQLRVLIEPFVAWHKGQILDTLPGITDLTVMLNLTTKQRELIKKDKTNEVRDNLQKRAAAIYVHPILEPVAEGGKRTQKDPRLKGDNIDVSEGAKLRWVLDLVELCEAAKEKVLVFSEYLYSLALIENMTQKKMKWSKGSQILRLDGSLQPQEREKIVNKFNTDPEARILCASIKACGEGISLVGASRVVLLEVLWNPAVTRQAISRAFRIGQKKKVFVYRLIAADTYEEHRMHATATRKEWLSKLLFDPTISCDDPNSILWDVTKDCSDSLFVCGKLRDGVKEIYEREF